MLVNCTHCGTRLPPGALFCGECGRAVPSAASRPPSQAPSIRSSPSTPSGAKVLTPARWVEDPVTGQPLANEIDEASEVDVEVRPGLVRCEQCGTVMASDDIFCPECGFVSRSITRAFSTSDFTDATRQLDFDPVKILVDQDASASRPAVAEPEAVEVRAPEPPAERRPEPEPDQGASTEARAESGPTPHLLDATPAPPPLPRAPRMPAAPPSRPIRSSPIDDADDDLEATRIVNRMAGDRFVLQFSTGESFTVHGSGLVGRNPQPEPGEFFDHLVRVLDTGKSVSKTHLEFGQEHGAFWVKDRYSGNGTVIREPEISARRAEADRRYRVVRGTRIDIGEQFFVIS